MILHSIRYIGPDEYRCHHCAAVARSVMTLFYIPCEANDDS